MIIYRKFGIRIAEVWFDEPAPTTGTDVVFFFQRSQSVAGASCQKKYSLLVDLSCNQDVLFLSFNKNLRKAILRAHDKDGIICETVSAKEQQTVTAFCQFYNRLAAHKGLAVMRPSRLSSYASSGFLEFSVAKDSSGEVLVWHASIFAGGKARILYSASHFRDTVDSHHRNLIGRANRYLHWVDMLRFKCAGMKYYDFGGWYAGDTDNTKLRINRFKEEFGGSKICCYDVVVPSTLQGRVVLWGCRRLRKNGPYNAN